MVSVLQPARVIFDPLDGLSAAVEARRWVWPLLFLAAAVSFSGAAFALRWQAAPTVIRQLEMSGELQNTTEQDLAQQVVTARRVRLVSGVAQGMLGAPLVVLLVALVLKLAGWFFEAPAAFERCFSAAAMGLIPVALFHLMPGASMLRQPALAEAQLAQLVPSSLLGLAPYGSVVAQRLLATVDFFKLWSAGLLGLGFAAASGMRRTRALLLGFTLYVMYVGVFAVGIPGMRGGAA